MATPGSECPSFLYPSSSKEVWGYHDYKLLRIHGRCQLGTANGYGRVWFVKSLAENCRDIEECRRSLIKEYEILLSLRGGPIADAFALCEIEGVGLSIVMDYIDGLHLDDFMEKASVRKKRGVLRNLVEAMAFVHSRGVAHLDLKPENILVRGTYTKPEICLIDFNLSDSCVYCYNKEVGGNAEYAAPEQLEEGYEADVRADVWSLGKILEKFNAGLLWKKAIRHALQDNPEKRPVDASALLAFERGRRLILKYGAIALSAAAIITAGITFFPHQTGKDDLSVASYAPGPTYLIHDTIQQSVSSPEIPAAQKKPDGISLEQKYAVQLKEYDRTIAQAKKDLKHAITILLPNWKGDTSASAITRRGDFSTYAIRLLQGISNPLMELRMTLPEELLSSHSVEWCSSGDTQLRELMKEYQETMQKIDAGLAKDVEEEKTRKEEERRKERESHSH